MAQEPNPGGGDPFIVGSSGRDGRVCQHLKEGVASSKVFSVRKEVLL